MTRIGVYTENYIIGGAERYLGDLMEGLVRRGHEISLFSNTNPAFDLYLIKRQLSGIPHRTIPIWPPTLRLVQRGRTQIKQTANQVNVTQTTPRQLTKEVANGFWRYTATGPNLALLASVFRSQTIDVLHINNGGYPAAESCRMAVLAASWAGIQICVMTVHSPALKPAWPSPLERALDRAVAQRLQCIITMSQSTARSLIEMRGMPPSKVQPMNLGIDLFTSADVPPRSAVRDQLGIPPTAFVVGLVGRFDWYKGHRHLLEAMDKLIRAGQAGNLHLLLVGDGDGLLSMKSLAQDLGLSDRVVFTGFYPDALAAMRACDVVAMLSVGNEGQGYVILEAMSQAKPVIATNVCGLSEVVKEHETGLLVTPADSDSLAAAIRQLMNNEQMRLSMGLAGRKRLEERFSLDQMVADTERIYLELLAERPGR